MSDEIEMFEKYLLLPETNRAIASALLDNCMADSLTVATDKAVAFVMNEVCDERR